eukprot:gnl/MRDRNA2_/MRDRNA2_27046_c0_seq1.p1 gnl/MRDRNA2_/MRDRNA2_27046_c0~~gnl/MRDRNA2_/MRDRNA2_27046_c0_seq1.p1  ORF type:complete len:179 (-),score=50.20 gnl/MRDRNA2_/MRDRNA2_27046_c0_seq1:23-559(-)
MPAPPPKRLNYKEHIKGWDDAGGGGWGDPTAEDLLEEKEFLKEMASLPKRALVVRWKLIKHPELLILQSFMEPEKGLRICCLCHAVSEHSAESGEGDARAFIVGVYYEPKDESKVIKTLKEAGIDLTKHAHGGAIEPTPVDPDSDKDHEKFFLHAVGEDADNLFYMDWDEYDLIPLDA